MAQAEQYFAAEPQSKDVRKTLHVTLRGNEADVEVSNGVFSGNRVDLGTSVLLRQAPEPPEEGTFLDLGCGWGPIALTLGFESPKADIWALDVNERALELTRRNAELNGMGNIHAVTAEQVQSVAAHYFGDHALTVAPPLRFTVAFRSRWSSLSRTLSLVELVEAPGWWSPVGESQTVAHAF